jgi:hypothetical protein
MHHNMKTCEEVEVSLHSFLTRRKWVFAPLPLYPLLLLFMSMVWEDVWGHQRVYCSSPQVIWVWRGTVKWYWQGKKKTLERNLSQYHFVLHKSTWTDPGANQSLRGKGPATTAWAMAQSLLLWKRPEHDVVTKRKSTASHIEESNPGHPACNQSLYWDSYKTLN